MNLVPVEMRPGPEGRLDRTELTEKDFPGSMPYFKSAYEVDIRSLLGPGPELGGPVDALLLLDATKLISPSSQGEEEESLWRCGFGL